MSLQKRLNNYIIIILLYYYNYNKKLCKYCVTNNGCQVCILYIVLQITVPDAHISLLCVYALLKHRYHHQNTHKQLWLCAYLI